MKKKSLMQRRLLLAEAIRDDLVVHDTLTLADVWVPMEVIKQWSIVQVLEATYWAGKEYLKASDNNVRVPSMPEFLREYRKKS